MEKIIFTYDKDQSRKNGQFTVVLTPAVFNRGRWEIPRRTKIYFVKDLETVAARVPDKALFRTALESEMAFRKNEARFFNQDQEFTRLRIASRHLFTFIGACRKHRMLIHPDGSVAIFRMDTDVIPEIGVQDDHLALHLGSLTLAEAEIIVQAMPVTLIKGNRIVQLRPDLPFAFLKAIPTDKALDEAERIRLLLNLSKQPDKLRIRNTGKSDIRTVRNASAQAVVSLDDRAAKARLYFVYKGNRVKDNDETSVIVDIRRHLEIHRNRPAEEGFKAIMLAHGFAARPERDFNWRAPDRSLESLVPSLENHGFAVNIGSRKLAEPVSVRWNVQTQKQHLRVGAMVFSGEFQFGADGLFQAFREGRRYVERPDGSLGIISGEIRRVLAELSQNGIVDQGVVTFSKADFTSVRASLAGEADVRTDSSFEALCRFGGRMDGVRRYPIPAGLETVLRPYQILGFNWLRTLKELGLNGILADDMGLGKSVQVLALIKCLKVEGSLGRPVLLIAPKTLLFNWELEIRKFAPDLSIYAFAGPARTRDPEFLKKHHLVLTSYGMLRTETPLLCSIQWEYVILDEAQAIKNADTMTSRAVRHLPASSRLSITGTPVENSAADLWSQFDFLMPGFLEDQASFKEKYDTVKDLERLREKTKPYILRRLKSQVLAELPPKTEVTIYCDFAEDQKSIYDQALAAARDEMDAMQGSRAFHILRLILRLRQIACHPRLAVKESQKPLCSGKTEEVFHTAVQILSEGHKILVFSQFTRHLQLIQELFLRHEIPTFYLDGRTTDRASVVNAFKFHAGPCPFFISLKAGGTGLNLSEASYVFLLDPWWNPAVENQAIDRSHRLGQHQPVTVYRFITRGSIEEKVDILKKVKKEIESAVMDESVPQYLSFDEKTLQRLLAD
ncbi:MAG: DEAD/DEAH box helicase [Desulfobacteraceae bacterium]|nr:MAG: DEAD/DEAH box helicase [Desulfobacteraceae bacterium]